jgi:hypothetical protein
MEKLEGAEDLGYGAYRVQLRMLGQYPNQEGTLSTAQGSLRLLTTFLARNVQQFREYKKLVSER